MKAQAAPATLAVAATGQPALMPYTKPAVVTAVL